MLVHQDFPFLKMLDKSMDFSKGEARKLILSWYEKSWELRSVVLLLLMEWCCDQQVTILIHLYLDMYSVPLTWCIVLLLHCSIAQMLLTGP